LGSSFLPDWSLQFHKRSIDGSGKCNIRNSGTGVYVAVFEMHVEDKEKLDGIEGIGNGYDSATIKVPEFDSCLTYLGSASHICDQLTTFDWYREMVLLGCRKLDFPGRYVATIEAVKTCPDPDKNRSREQWKIVERLRRNT
jgi:hypothetical protein